MKNVCNKNQCTGCMACVDICAKKAIRIEDNLEAYNAVIDDKKCVNCNACKKVCQKNSQVQTVHPVSWYQGWISDSNARNKSSSGGLAHAISRAFVDDGGVVCSCTFKNGQFVYDFAENSSELLKFLGSKYVKSNPAGVYVPIRRYLQQGRKVLFIGLPCHVAGLKKYLQVELQSQLYTADLICHGTPSPNLLNAFLQQYNRPLASMSKIIFRVKAKMQIHGDDKGIITKGVSDKYTIAFLNGLIYTENCYKCDYAKIERVSDITLGDSWGSELPMDEQRKGISLALCQTTKGEELLQKSNVELFAVDLAKAVESNHQLENPSVEPKNRRKFFRAIKKGHGFNLLVFIEFPKQCLRQDVKELLIHLKLIK